MKKLVTALGLLAVLASPVLAQSRPVTHRDANQAVISDGISWRVCG